MSLQYKSGGSWFDIPAAAIAGTYAGTFHVEYPPPTATGVDGAPCGATGKPRIVIQSDKISDEGMAFWRAFFAAPTDAYVAIEIEAFDKRTGTNVKWAGNLKWPTDEGVSVGSTAAQTMYRDVLIEITECAETT